MVILTVLHCFIGVVMCRHFFFTRTRNGASHTDGHFHVNDGSTFFLFLSGQILLYWLVSKDGFEPSHAIFGPKGGALA